MTPVRDLITEGLDALERDEVLGGAVVAALRVRHEGILTELDDAALSSLPVLHGDAHADNLLHSGTGWLWIDLEETCRGPREFDLAVLPDTQGEDGPAALAAYADVMGTPIPEPEALIPFVRARELEGAVWTLGMAHQYPARYRDTARTLLATVLGTPAA